MLAQARAETGLAIVTEVMSEDDVPLVAEYADILQIGSRSMENYTLLEAAAKSQRPILLKRGMMATIGDLLKSAQIVLENGNPNVILCERGIRTFDATLRNTFDVAAIALLKQISHLPVIADPSHACGHRDLVPALARIGVAAGADGLIVEVHPNPEKAWSDGEQSLNFAEFDAMMASLKPYIALRGTMRRCPDSGDGWMRVGFRACGAGGLLRVADGDVWVCAFHLTIDRVGRDCDGCASVRAAGGVARWRAFSERRAVAADA